MKGHVKYCTILGTRINVTNMSKTISYIENNLTELKGNYICVSNVHTTVMSHRDEAYRQIQNNAAMALPDGKPLSIVSRKRGYWGAERVPGPDLMLRIFERSAKKGYSHFLYGSTEDTLRLLQQKMTEQYPGVNIAGSYSPPFRPLGKEEDEEVIALINKTKADFIWVALGAPKQEQWMAAHQHKVCGIMIGVGAAFDFHAGTVKRAPGWMQEWCLEWFYRLFQDPKRLIPRYLDTNFAFVWNSMKEGRKLRKQKEIKRIAMIGHKRIPSREGGVEVVVGELVERLDQNGYQVDVYNRGGYHVSGKKYDAGDGKVFDDIRIITIPTLKNGKFNAIVYSILATIRALFGRYEVIHFHAEGPSIMVWLPKIFRIRIIVTIHGLDWQRAKWGNFAAFAIKSGERMAVRYADEIIVLSQNVQDYFMNVYQRKTNFIPNGVSRPVIKEPVKIRELYGLEKDEYILFVARLVPEKGVHYLIEAFLKIDTAKKLVIAGGSSHSWEYMGKIKEQAKQDKRIIMTDFVQGQVLEELYSNAYLFVLPSDIEGMAISLLEAMSYGNCCLVSDIRENVEVVEDQAVTFQKGNVEDLKDKLVQLVEEDDLVRQFKQTSSDFICRKYSWDHVVKDTEQLYQRKKKK